MANNVLKSINEGFERNFQKYLDEGTDLNRNAERDAKHKAKKEYKDAMDHSYVLSHPNVPQDMKKLAMDDRDKHIKNAKEHAKLANEIRRNHDTDDVFSNKEARKLKHINTQANKKKHEYEKSMNETFDGDFCRSVLDEIKRQDSRVKIDMPEVQRAVRAFCDAILDSRLKDALINSSECLLNRRVLVMGDSVKVDGHTTATIRKPYDNPANIAKFILDCMALTDKRQFLKSLDFQ